MLNVEPRMAGAASGFINTTRQLGGVIGSAAVGALLQAQLTVKLDAAAVRESAALPEAQRGRFVEGFHQAATGNLDVGSTSGGFKFPPGTPQQIQDLTAKVFGEGFANAMRVTLWLPIAVLALGALSVLLVRGRRSQRPGGPPAAEDTETPTVAVGG
jgi:hypothetical protein